MSRVRGFALALVAALVVLPAAAQERPPEVTAVEPAELAKRTDLVGREVSVEDRVALFVLHPGHDFDQIDLKRTTVPFRLPPHLRYRKSPGAPAARLQGVLRLEGGKLVCDVTAVELFPKDIDRLERGVAVLAPADFERRAWWARWALKRGEDFQDAELLKRGRELEVQAIRNEADHPWVDPPARWLAIARRAKEQRVPEPEPGALAHRAFRARAGAVKDTDELRTLADEIATFFPQAQADLAVDQSKLERYEAAYAANPSGTYRAAPEDVRRALDRKLWADAAEQLFDRRAAAQPDDAVALSEEAANQLPDRPQLSRRLLELGLKNAGQRVGTLRLSEVEGLARLYRERMNQPDRAKALLKSWLDEQRLRNLSPTDAEARITLAGQYEELLEDRDTAVELLKDAWKIDPKSRELADAFRRRGFRKLNDEWVAPARSRDGVDAPGQGKAGATMKKLVNLTPDEVRALLGGGPNRIVVSGSQGQLIEQWIYLGTRQNQYINFLRTAGNDMPRVVGYYSLDRATGTTRP